MPVSPETRYCLDGWKDAGAIAADVHHYFIGHCENPDDIVLPALNDGADTAALEHIYLGWRRENPALSAAMSLIVVDELRETIKRAVDDFVTGVTSCTPDRQPQTLAQLRGRDGTGILGFSPTLTCRMRVLRRALGRAAHDLAGLDADMIASLRENERRAQRLVYEREIAPLMTMLDDMCRAVDCVPVFSDGDLSKLAKPVSARERRSRIRRSRAIFKRSMAFLGKLVAAEPLRRFITQREPLRITGANCVYEITRRALQIDYGDAQLSLIDFEGQRICNVCLHTRGVPTLDHVAGIVLSVLSGREDEILAPGNFYEIAPGRPLPDWLAPYHPVTRHDRRQGAIQWMIDDVLCRPIIDPFLFEPITWALVQKLRRRTLTMIYAEIADLVSQIPRPPVVPVPRVNWVSDVTVINDNSDINTPAEAAA